MLSAGKVVTHATGQIILLSAGKVMTHATG